MREMNSAVTMPADSPDSKRYNRVRRWLGVADFVLGLLLLLALLVTGWSGSLRDLAYRVAFQNYSVAVFLYVFMLMFIAKVLGLGLDYYGFRLEHRYKLSNQKLRGWAADELKGELVEIGRAHV